MKKLLLLLILAFGLNSISFAGPYDDWPDDAVCMWLDIKPTHAGYLGEAKKRELSCEGGVAVKTKTTSQVASPAKTTQKTTTSVKVKPTELEMSSKFVGQFNLKKLSENSNLNLDVFTSIMNKFDINQDGHDDLILGNTTMDSDYHNKPNEFSKPVLLFWDNDIKEYIIDENVQKALPFMYFPRKIHGSINPKTGLTHLFIGDTGHDLANYDFSKGLANLPPDCGGQNHLITYDPSSGKVAEIKLPKLWDYTHALGAADINGDQINDYVVLNPPNILYPAKCLFKGADYTNENYILYSNKKGGFDKVNIKLNHKEYTQGKLTYQAAAVAIDNNNVYLILGTADFSDSIYAFKQDSKASFTETSKVNAPAFMRVNGELAAHVEVLYADVDGDDTKEVVSNIVNSKHDGRYLQLLDFNNGQLKDRSSDIVQSPSNASKGKDWCIHLFFNEKTAWNEPILTCTHLHAPTNKFRGSFYTWTENKLQLAKIKSKNFSEWTRRFLPVTIDQRTVFIGHNLADKRQVNGESFFDSIKLYLIEPIESLKPLEPIKKVGEAANSFDGSYAFIIRTEPDDGHKNIGTAQLIIKDGKISVARKYRYLLTSSTISYDTFEGVIDKEGNINASFELNPIRHMVEPKTIKFSGSMDSLQLRGRFDEIKFWDNETKKYVVDENFHTTFYDVIIDFKKENY